MSAQSDPAFDDAPQIAGESVEPAQPIRSFVTFTELPGTGGAFTLGLGLHGAHMAALNPEGADVGQPISSVDVVALAISHIVRTNPRDFQNSVALVQHTLAEVGKKLASGEDAAQVMAGANEVLSGILPTGGGDHG